jgi:hypothetical protein
MDPRGYLSQTYAYYFPMGIFHCWNPQGLKKLNVLRFSLSTSGHGQLLFTSLLGLIFLIGEVMKFLALPPARKKKEGLVGYIAYDI